MIPISASDMKSDDPPWLINGKVMPERGMSPTIALIFTNAWDVIIITIPTTISLPKESGVCVAIFSPLKVKNMNKIMINDDPINPNSSLATAKIESPIGSGKRLSNFCIL